MSVYEDSPATASLLSALDIARLFNRCTRTIRSWTRAGYLRPVRIGRAVFYRADDVRALFVEGGPKS